MGYPPGEGHVNGGSIMGWRWGKPPPPTPGFEQTENITFPHPSDAGGKNVKFGLFPKTSNDWRQ